MEELTIHAVRRLALARAGLLKPQWTRPEAGAGESGRSARCRILQVIQRFGYLQLDSVSVAGARSHSIVLLSRLAKLPAGLGEGVLQPDEPVFEYWGHEACWMPMDLYPLFAFRRQAFRSHPWWGDLVGAHPKVARDILKRIANEGPLGSKDFEDRDHKGGRGWWNHGLTKRVATALWSSGELAIRARNGFHRTFDLAERVIPAHIRRQRVTPAESIRVLLLKALAGHGWASTATLAATWRLRRRTGEVDRALRSLEAEGAVVATRLCDAGATRMGWCRPADLELVPRLERTRPRSDHGVLLSPFDPVLWDRKRVRELFGFDQRLEIYKPKARRVYGYYVLPVLAGERLVGRVDLKAHRKEGRLEVLSVRFGPDESQHRPHGEDRQAMRFALERYASALELDLRGQALRSVRVRTP